MGGDDKVNTEGETNIQTVVGTPNNKQEESDTSTVLQTETDVQEIQNKISEGEIDQAIIKVEKENNELLGLDKIKRLFNGELEVLKFKAYKLAKSIKDTTLSKAGKIVSTTALAFVLASCASSPKVVMAVPQEMTERAEQRQTQTQEATPPSEATLSPEEIREKRLNEIAEVVKENDYRFTVEELSKYLQEHGTGWEGGVESLIKKYEGSNAPFKYFFIEKDENNSGLYLNPVPYQFDPERTMYDVNPFPCPEMINEREVGKILESVYVDLWIKEDGKYTGYFVEKDGGYRVIIYMTQGINENGEPYDIMIPDIGIYSFKDTEGEIKSVLWEEAANKNLTDEEMAFFTDEVLESLRNQEGWTMFVSDEDGNLEEKTFNAKDFYNLLHPATSSDTVAQEIN